LGTGDAKVSSVSFKGIQQKMVPRQKYIELKTNCINSHSVIASERDRDEQSIRTSKDPEI